MKCLFVCLVLISASTVFAADVATRNVQQQLSDLGFYYGQVDGEPGPETEAAIRRYQIRNGLAVTGTLTQETVERLRGNNSPRTQNAQQPLQSPRTPVRQPAPSVVESDREFLESVPGSQSEEGRTVRGQEVQPPSDERWRGETSTADLNGFDILFAGTPLAEAESNVQQEVLVRAQIALQRYRYYPGQIDGLPGQMTTRAILEFQRDERLSRTGRLDIVTLRALGIRRGDVYRNRRFYVEPPKPVFRGYWVN